MTINCQDPFEELNSHLQFNLAIFTYTQLEKGFHETMQYLCETLLEEALIGLASRTAKYLGPVGR